MRWTRGAGHRKSKRRDMFNPYVCIRCERYTLLAYKIRGHSGVYCLECMLAELKGAGSIDIQHYLPRLHGEPTRVLEDMETPIVVLKSHHLNKVKDSLKGNLSEGGPRG